MTTDALATTYATHQSRYHHLGWTVIEEAVPRPVADEWANEIFAIIGRQGTDVTITTEARVEVPSLETADETLDEGGAYRHALLEGETVRRCLPELYGFYLGLPLSVEAIVCRPIVLSPYPRSAVNVKFYEAPGGEQGWHRDTNAVTALLYLTDDGHPTVVENLRGEVEDIGHQPGDLLLMQGRRCRHHVPPMSPGTPARLTVPLNLYHPDDTWRPEAIDSLVYGPEKSASAMD
jgi:hypothetical protein